MNAENMNTENIQKFLMSPEEGGAYTDEKLAALLAHAQDGKLAFDSCCCLLGVANATHALQEKGRRHKDDRLHHHRMRNVPFAMQAEHEFAICGYDDAERRERLIPLILAEMERREKRQEPDPRDEEGSDVRPELEIYKGR